MSFLDELKQRNVLRVGAAYAVAAWLLIQIAETIFPLFGFGETPARVVVVVLAIGFIPALLVAWAFELTPEGLRREPDADRTPAASRRATHRLDRFVIVSLALALGYFAFDRFVLAPEREASVAEKARAEARSEALRDSYGDKSIAVLPFTDMSPDRDQEYLSDGIAEELLNVLARVPELRVISRTSSFAFRDETVEVPEIARRLKVGHVLEGSVRKSGNTVRITAQLIEARSDTHLWSATWDRELQDVFVIQDEIAAQVARELQLKLLGASLIAARPVEPEVYEDYLKGLHLLADRNPEAERFFERVIERAPDYAPAHANLAKLLALMAGRGDVDQASMRNRAKAAARRALGLDRNSSDALAALALLALSDNDVELEREYLKLAIESNPNNVDAYRWLAYSYRNVDSVRYLEFMQKGYRVAPTSNVMCINFFEALARFGRYEEALQVARDLHELYPDQPTPFALAGRYFVHTGELDQALRSYFRAFRLAPASVDAEVAYVGWLVLQFQPEGPELALQWAMRRMANNPDSQGAFFQRVIATELTGRHEEAVRLIEEADANGSYFFGALARSYLLVLDDPANSRRHWEQMAANEDIRYWDAYRIVDYAEALSQTGDARRARELIVSTLARVEQQMGAGVQSEAEWDLKFYAAIMYAMLGNNERALSYLRDDAATGGLSCLTCLQTWPQLDALSHNPEFQALLTQQDEFNGQWRRRLTDEGLLLTPEQVLNRSESSFEPFFGPD